MAALVLPISTSEICTHNLFKMWYGNFFCNISDDDNSTRCTSLADSADGNESVQKNRRIRTKRESQVLRNIPKRNKKRYANIYDISKEISVLMRPD
jgi:hypothetical protein